MELDWPMWLRIAKEFQAAIGAAVGFIGVIVTISVNYRLGRREPPRVFRRLVGLSQAAICSSSRAA